MSKLTRMAATSHDLSLAAMEEASRTGERTADIEHLLMALSLSEQPAGQVLRGLGVTLAALREAVAEQRGAELGILGVAATIPTEQRIVFHETGGYEWSERAMRLIDHVSKSEGGPSAVLIALLDEPSGRIHELLARTGVTAEDVRGRLAATAHLSMDVARVTRSEHQISRRSQFFIPASVAEVWALVIDPLRLPEWDLNIGQIDASAEGGPWAARTMTHRPDGKPVRVGPGLEEQEVELVEREGTEHVAWRFRYPARPALNSRLITLDLEPAAEGTQLTVTFSWELVGPRRASPFRAVLRWLMRPAVRFALWMQVSQVGASISRVFR